MAHIHSVYDTDAHFQIDGVTRAVKNASATKTMVVQHDHNSERFTFEVPRLIDGHDMSTCNVVQVHYINTDSTDRTKFSTGVYEVDDLQISPGNEDVVICSWLISSNATKHVGNLSFVIRFVCSTDGEIDYAWNTAVHSNVYVSKGIFNGDVIVKEYADVLEQWRQELFQGSGTTGTDGVGISNIEKTDTSGLVDTYIITLTDNSTYTFTVTNGAKGETGSTPNITIGTVSTLDAGSDATANITGTAENPVLHLGIPKGTDGGDATTPRQAMTASDTDATLQPNILYVFPEMASLTVTLAEPSDTNVANEYHFFFTSGSTATTLTLNDVLSNAYSIEANMKYEVSVLEGVAYIKGVTTDAA